MVAGQFGDDAVDPFVKREHGRHPARAIAEISRKIAGCVLQAPREGAPGRRRGPDRAGIFRLFRRPGGSAQPWLPGNSEMMRLAPSLKENMVGIRPGPSPKSAGRSPGASSRLPGRGRPAADGAPDRAGIFRRPGGSAQPWLPGSSEMMRLAPSLKENMVGIRPGPSPKSAGRSPGASSRLPGRGRPAADGPRPRRYFQAPRRLCSVVVAEQLGDDAVGPFVEREHGRLELVDGA